MKRISMSHYQLKDFDRKTPLPNPDPKNFTIELFAQIGKFLIVEINYPNCTNYEGNKLLVYKDVKIKELLKMKEIDPHFEKKRLAPIARFRPTKEGWEMAKKLAMVA